jgi:glutamate-1-semialdehyde 2,1-aminomutase
LGDVYQAGTLSGNPLATAAGLTVLSELTEDRHAELDAKAETLATGLSDAFAGAGMEARVPRVGPLVGIFFGGGEMPVDFDTAHESVSLGQYPAFFHAMLGAGVAFAPGPYEVLFTSLAHSDADLELTVEAAAAAAESLRA